MYEIKAAVNRLKATEVKASSPEEAAKVLQAVEKVLGKHAKTREKMGTQYVDWKSTKDWAAGLEYYTESSKHSPGTIWFIFQPKAMRRAWFSAAGKSANEVLDRIHSQATSLLKHYGQDPKLQATKAILEKLASVK